MTKRERVEAAMRGQETDRVPVYDLMASDHAIAHFAACTPGWGEEAIRQNCRAIGRMLDMTRGADGEPAMPGETTDDDGFVRYRQDRWIDGGIRHRPFSDERGAREWIAKAITRIRRDTDTKRIGANHRARFLQLQGYIGDDTVQLMGQSGTGLDDVRFFLGLELFSYVDVEDPGIISEYLEVYTNRQVAIIHAVADPALSPCALTYGDIACKRRTIHSPDWLRREFYPRLSRLNDAWHEHGIRCLFHSDGYLMDAMDDLMATGIDGLNPIEIVAGMDLADVRRRCGGRLFLTGGIDISQLMAMSGPEEVRRVCRDAIAAASPGYFIGSTTELDNGSRLDNIIAMLETAWESTEGCP